MDDEQISALIDQWYFHSDIHVKAKLLRFARELLSESKPAESEAWEFRQFDGWHPCTEPLEWYDRRAFQLRKAKVAASTQSGEPDKWVAKVRVTHKGYSMELSKYIAYALPEGVHELYAVSQSAQTEQPPNVEQCGCQISHAEFSSTGELKRVTIHYGDSRVAYVVLPTGGAAAAPAQSAVPNKAFASVLMDAAAKSGDEGAIRLAAQLAGVAPCAKCGFVNYHCRCAPTPAPAQLEEPRNVEGMTRAEFASHLRVCFQHDNVRARERGRDAPLHSLTTDQEREIAERVELSYPASAYNYPPKACLGCTAWDSGASEVHFIQGCEGCRTRMAQANGTAAPQSAQTGRTHTTQPGESVMGIALRQCGDESAWRRILACNPKFADLSPSDYFPVGTVLVMPPSTAAAQPASGSDHD